MYDLESANCNPFSQDSDSGLVFSDCFDEDPTPSKSKLDWLPSPSPENEQSRFSSAAEELLREATTFALFGRSTMLGKLSSPGPVMLGKLSSPGDLIDIVDYEEELFTHKAARTEPRQTRHEFGADGKTPKSTMEYTPDGKVVARTEFGADGKTPTATFEYNQQRNLWLKTDFAPDGKTPKEYSILDPRGSTLHSKTMDPDGKTPKARTMYSKDGERLKRTDYWDSGKLSSVMSYVSDKPSSRIDYDKDGRKTRVVGYFENGQLQSEITFYNTGKLKEQTYYLFDGKKDLHVEDDKDGNSIRTEYKDGLKSRSFVYDDKNRLNAEWTYHENGRMKTMTVYTSSGKPQVITFNESGRR